LESHSTWLGIFYFFDGGTSCSFVKCKFVLSKFILGYSILLIAHLAVHYNNMVLILKWTVTLNLILSQTEVGVLVKNPDLKDFSKQFSLFIMGLSILLTAAFTVNIQLSGYILFISSLWKSSYLVLHSSTQ
jgi:1,4-dihydroxy-2-naphthoate octaprenyltransferase